MNCANCNHEIGSSLEYELPGKDGETFYFCCAECMLEFIESELYPEGEERK